MQEELDGKFVHLEAFGKRKGLAHEPPQALAQGVVEALDVVGGAFGIRGLVSRGGQDVAIAFQMIGARRALTVSGWDAGPKQLSRGVIARPQGMSDDLAGAPTEGQPRAENEDQDGGQRRAAGDGAPFPSEGLHRALQALFGLLGGFRDLGQGVEQGPSGLLERPFCALGQGCKSVVQRGFDALSNRRLQVKGGFLSAAVEGAGRVFGPLAGGGQRPRLLFEPVQQLGDAVLLLVGQLDQGGE